MVARVGIAEERVMSNHRVGYLVGSLAEGDKMGAIAITVADGVTVSTDPDGDETIGLFHGAGNSIVNDGAILHPGADSDDYVLRTNGYPVQIYNNGLLRGSILTASSQADGPPGGPITIANARGAVAGLGATVDLGPEGVLTNEGVISAAAVGTIAF